MKNASLDDERKFLFEDSIDEADYCDLIPLCGQLPQRLALIEQEELERQRRELQEKEDYNKAQDIYRHLARE